MRCAVKVYFKEIETSALKLDEKHRAELAKRLLISLEKKVDEDKINSSFLVSKYRLTISDFRCFPKPARVTGEWSYLPENSNNTLAALNELISPFNTFSSISLSFFFTLGLR